MLFLLLFIGLLVVVVTLSLTDDTTKEGFSYKRCINRGFSSSFCLTTPIAGATTDVCPCKDGSTGVTMYGTGARCMCGTELTDEWLQSREPLLYDGSQFVPGTGTEKSSLLNNEADVDAEKSEKDKLANKNKGRWWYKIEWI